ncbi:MAG: CpaF family protein [Proteobacteria bacterium]|nr:CpaF family protein [Pseudomonadota bacterium]
MAAAIELASGLHERLIERLDLRRTDINRMTDAELWTYAQRHLQQLIDQSEARHSPERGLLERQILQEVVGLGAVEDLLSDDSISEIMINGPGDVFVERHGRIERMASRFSSTQSLAGVIERLLQRTGRRVDESSPMVDARLPDGSRINVIVPPLALCGPALTIRKFGQRRHRLSDLVGAGTLSAAMADFLQIAVRARRNIVVSGGTGTGKTTLLNCLSGLIPPGERVITIEDSAELQLAHANLVALEARPSNAEGVGLVSIRDLVRNALRMRPDRIVVGECRGGETLDMLQAMNTGHDGSLTTAHANSPRDLLSRLEVMTLMAGMDLPLGAIREQIASAVNLIVQLARFSCGSRRVVAITEIAGTESGRIQMQDLFRFHAAEVDRDGVTIGHFRTCGNEPRFYESLAAEHRPPALCPEGSS